MVLRRPADTFPDDESENPEELGGVQADEGLGGVNPDQDLEFSEEPSGLYPEEELEDTEGTGEDDLDDPDNFATGERVELASEIYDEVRLAIESLQTIDDDLDEPELDRWEMVRARAHEHLEVAERALNDLAELMQDLHLRPSEDSSDDAFLTPSSQDLL